MTTENFTIEQSLRDIYYDPSRGFSSADALYRKAKEQKLKVTKKQVVDWVHSQDTYTKFKQFKKPRKFQRVFTPDFGVRLQMDLVDMQKFSSENEDYKGILTSIEILSRYAFAIPVRRKDKINMTETVEKILKEFSTRFDRFPTVIQFDEGGEFYNVGVKELFKDYDIKYFSLKSDKKASVVERFNRTLKTKMWKYFNHAKSNEWLDVLDDFVDNYNNSVHRTIKMKPVDVDDENKDVVFATLYGYGTHEQLAPKPKFEVGDHVRIYEYKSKFAKGFEASFSGEIFTVSKIFRGDPNMYKIKDDENEPVTGKFYESEMVKSTT